MASISPAESVSWLNIAPMAAHYGKPEQSSRSSFSSVDEPPAYNAQICGPRARSNWNVQPRESEGCEELPSYSASICLENVFLRKLEVEGAVYKAYDRCWYKEHVTLRGTVLIVHKLKRHIFSRPAKLEEDDPDLPAGSEKGRLVKCYNLRHTEVGIAADYTKKKYVIRIRAETDQFLLSCTRIETFITWLHSLFTAIDLALPLDERTVPQDHTVPRSRRCGHRHGESGTTTDRHEALVRQQISIMRRHYPNLASTDSTADESEEEGETSTENNIYVMFAVSPPANGSRRHVRRSVTTSDSAQAPESEAQSHERPASRRAVIPVPDEDGKWRPEHEWCSRYDMLYAKKCMAVLTGRAPRKSKLLVLDGKQYQIDWSTGDLRSLEPPAYNGKDKDHKLRIGRYGQVLKF